jgi:hypothetical protein
MNAFAWPGRLHGSLRSVQRLDGSDRHQVLHGVGELPVERDQRVGVELGQGGMLGVKGVRPAEQAGCCAGRGMPGPKPGQRPLAAGPSPHQGNRPSGSRDSRAAPGVLGGQAFVMAVPGIWE